MECTQEFEMLLSIQSELKKRDERISELERDLYATDHQLNEFYNLTLELQSRVKSLENNIPD